MIEDDYTGSPLGDEFDDEFDLMDVDLDEWADEDAEFNAEFESPDETIINVLDAVEGSKSLQDAAERLYVLADELLSLAAIGWELMDDMTGGQGVALMVGDNDADMPEGL